MKRSSTLSRPFTNVAIVGVGLIGGSLGLAIKHRFPRTLITAYDSPDVLRRALRRGAVDIAARSLKAAVQHAELVILASPVSSILNSLGKISRSVSADTIVTDVGSVKSVIVRRASRFFPKGNFIGGHPMAGVEFSGIEAASPLLFENAVYVLTPTRLTPHRPLQRLGNFLAALGARVLVLDAKTHDSVAAAVSHLPQLAAVALMNVVGGEHKKARRHLHLAAGGFRDLTRIASSKPEMWKDVLSFNRKEIVDSLRLYIAELRLYAAAVERGGGLVRSKFLSARKLRDMIPKNMKGFLHPLSSVYVFVNDRPGMLARMTAALAGSRISIKDIELLKVREGIGGTFRVSFESRDVAERAERILRKRGFEITEVG